MNNIILFESKKVRRVWNDSEQKWYFSVQDVLEILTDSADIKQYIKKMRHRDPELNSNWGTLCTPVEMTAADGKRRKIQAANSEGLLRIIQSVPGSKAEPFKRWFTRVGYEDAQGFYENKQAANEGGTVAGNARRELESRSGTRVSTEANFKQLPEKDQRELLKKSE